MTPNSTHLAAGLLASVLAIPLGHSAELLGYWNFDDPFNPGAEVSGSGAPDLTLSPGASQTPDAGGLSLKAGDRALDTGGYNNQGHARTTGGPHFDQILTENAYTVVLWQFNREIANTSSFWVHAPTSGGNQRGIQAHIPWGDGTIRFDQSGCCDPEERLTVADQVRSNTWQHFAFRRDSDGNRDIFVDGMSVASAGAADPLEPFDGILTIGAEGPSGNKSLNGIIDEFAIFAGALTDKEIADLASEQRVIDVINPARPTIKLHKVEHYGDGFTALTWESFQGAIYAIHKSTDLTGDPVTWPVIFETGGWQWPSRYTRAVVDWDPFETQAFYAVVEVPRRPFFKDDFETDQGWTTGINDGAGETVWQRGPPSNVGPPTGAGGSNNCFGTNLDGEYGLNSDSFLRSPEIGIAGSMDGYRLTYQQFTDIETASDFGSVELYDSWTLEPLVVLEQTIDGATDGWVQFSTFWGSTGVENGVVIEFRFSTDDSGTAAGWYIDNVRFEVIVPRG